MASRASKTTFAKLDRERRLQEKRQTKLARREARRAEAAAVASGEHPLGAGYALDAEYPLDAELTDDSPELSSDANAQPPAEQG